MLAQRNCVARRIEPDEIVGYRRHGRSSRCPGPMLGAI
jgi:hypothetical protein